jgi:CDP-2,3-bis-(O-geranylgeranyl)-sn-glycerol synthase
MGVDGARMRTLVILKLLTLLAVANGTPLIAKNVFRNRFSQPIDGGVKFVDGKPLFGSSKTIRGIALSILVTTACAPVFGLAWEQGAVVGSAAMAGDLLSSFLKRRINLPAEGMATGLDQVPESLFPLLACRGSLSLTAVDIAVGVAVFLLCSILFSGLLYKLRLRDRPY